MKLIAITSETARIEEVPRVVEVLSSGIDYVHLRKPNLNDEEMRLYLSLLPTEFLSRITLGTHTYLANEFAVGGIHHNSGVAESVDRSGDLRISRSCHTIAEVVKYAGQYDYVFLSPVFNSISKSGYNSKFRKSELLEYGANGYLRNVVALGGIDDKSLSEVKELGFYGAAFLGYLFGDITDDELNNRLSIIKSEK